MNDIFILHHNEIDLTVIPRKDVDEFFYLSLLFKGTEKENELDFLKSGNKSFFFMLG